jgi:hypothetical protein
MPQDGKPFLDDPVEPPGVSPTLFERHHAAVHDLARAIAREDGATDAATLLLAEAVALLMVAGMPAGEVRSLLVSILDDVVSGAAAAAARLPRFQTGGSA